MKCLSRSNTASMPLHTYKSQNTKSYNNSSFTSQNRNLFSLVGPRSLRLPAASATSSGSRSQKPVNGRGSDASKDNSSSSPRHSQYRRRQDEGSRRAPEQRRQSQPRQPSSSAQPQSLQESPKQQQQSQGPFGPSSAAAGPPVQAGQQLELECARLALEGKGVCLLPPTGFVVLVERTLPGERVLAEMLSVKRGYAEARKLASLAPHRHAVPPPCPYFGPCGGCTLQSLDYLAQLREKRNQVEQTLRRVGRLGPSLDRLAQEAAAAVYGDVASTGTSSGSSSSPADTPAAVAMGVAPTIGCEAPFGYRNKMTFHFSSRCWVPPGEVVDRPALGFLRPGTADVVLPVVAHGCQLQGPVANAILSRVSELVSKHGLLPYNHPSGQGFLKHLVIRSGSGLDGAAAAPSSQQAGSLAPSSSCSSSPSSSGSTASPASSAGSTREFMAVFGVTRGSAVQLLRPLAEDLAREFPDQLVSIVAQQVVVPQPPPRSAAVLEQATVGRKPGRERERERGRGRGSSSRDGRPAADGSERERGGGPTSGRRAATAAAVAAAAEVDDGGGDSLTGFADGDGDGGDSGGGSGGDGSGTVLYGTPYIHDRLCGLSFRVSPGSFFQTNSRQAEVLYGVVRAAAALAPGDTVLDLYCGTGTIGLSLAGDCRTVVGVEVLESAVADARRNADLNGITNAAFIRADVDRVPNLTALLPSSSSSSSTPSSTTTLSSSPSSSGPDVVVVDPARGGLSTSAAAYLNRCGARRLVYVSCNVATQARDLDRLVNGPGAAFRLVSVQPLDMFPHTDHVEVVAVLERVVA